VFITSTTREAQGVRAIVGIGDWPNAPGPITAAAHAAYDKARRG
jgi:branched-subunit amino acid aminotransferase/4-amino-4-deoxychorismate lyase